MPTQNVLLLPPPPLAPAAAAAAGTAAAAASAAAAAAPAPPTSSCRRRRCCCCCWRWRGRYRHRHRCTWSPILCSPILCSPFSLAPPRLLRLGPRRVGAEEDPAPSATEVPARSVRPPSQCGNLDATRRCRRRHFSSTAHLLQPPRSCAAAAAAAAAAASPQLHRGANARALHRTYPLTVCCAACCRRRVPPYPTGDGEQTEDRQCKIRVKSYISAFESEDLDVRIVPQPASRKPHDELQAIRRDALHYRPCRQLAALRVGPLSPTATGYVISDSRSYRPKTDRGRAGA